MEQPTHKMQILLKIQSKIKQPYGPHLFVNSEIFKGLKVIMDKKIFNRFSTFLQRLWLRKHLVP